MPMPTGAVVVLGGVPAPGGVGVEAAGDDTGRPLAGREPVDPCAA